MLPGYKVGKNDLVIDIGSGDKPFWRANIFFDKLSLDNFQRFTHGNTVKNIGNFVDGDITKTNFKSKVFDFSFCSHVLEHVEKPDIAIEEITRISKAGYIEVPNGLLEYIKPFSTHLWFIFISNNKLFFFRKSKKLHDVLSKNSTNFPDLSATINEPFIRLYWKNKINYEITDINDYEKFKSPSIKRVRKEVITNILYSFLSRESYILFVKLIRRIHGVDNRVKIKDLIKK